MRIIVDEDGEIRYLDKFGVTRRAIAAEIRRTIYDKERDESIIELCFDTLRDMEDG